jgi:hypothetical protein
MVNLHLVLYVVALVCFIVAACPTGSRFRWEWFGAAALTLTLVI